MLLGLKKNFVAIVKDISIFMLGLIMLHFFIACTA